MLTPWANTSGNRLNDSLQAAAIICKHCGQHLFSPDTGFLFLFDKKMKKKILIAGIGNLLLGDEGIGVHVIRELSRKALPEEVELAEIGTATFELARFMQGKQKVIIVDAVLTQEPPGTISKLTQDDLEGGERKPLTHLHQYGIIEALESAALMGTRPGVVIFGITPKDYQTPSLKLTPELKKSLPRIVEAILNEIAY